ANKKYNTITSKKLSPWWITGITDSEGNFSINYNTKSNKVTFSYKITQNSFYFYIAWSSYNF
uniref:hypothetical protein n=1 Tax=Coccidioides immitis TaxID=5501 RepID=UPI001D022A35